ncbi:MAG: hypothetical protein ACI33O_09330, partial [Bhargavaea sp.]
NRKKTNPATKAETAIPIAAKKMETTRKKRKKKKNRKIMAKTAEMATDSPSFSRHPEKGCRVFICIRNLSGLSDILWRQVKRDTTPRFPIIKSRQEKSLPAFYDVDDVDFNLPLSTGRLSEGRAPRLSAHGA